MTTNNKKYRYYLLGLLLLPVLFVTLTSPVSAATASCNMGKILPPCVCTGNCDVCDFVSMFINLATTFFLSIAALFALWNLVNGAFTMVVSAGNAQRLEAGKNALTGAIVGLVLVFAAWIIINTLFSFFVGSEQPWWNLTKTCPAHEETTTEETSATEPAPSSPDQCTNLQALAARYNVPYPEQISPSLTALRNCIESHVAAGMIDAGQIYTVDRDHGACNFTRGERICGTCSHMIHSCHYGGASGTQGAMGVDYNAKSPYSEDELEEAINEALDGPCQGLAGYHDQEDGTHTHISTIDCSGR